jgi:hypothetical protein
LTCAVPRRASDSFWRTKEHPDPDGETLELVISSLEKRWPEFEKLGVTDLGLIVDYCALWQAPRTAEQDVAFKEGLKGINLWYAHQGTTVWLVTAGADRVKGLSYWDKGWTSFEFALSHLIKPANSSYFKDWPQVCPAPSVHVCMRTKSWTSGQRTRTGVCTHTETCVHTHAHAQVVDLGAADERASIDSVRPSLCEPLAFFGGHEYGAKTYTNGADRDDIVAPKFRQTTFEVFGGVKVLSLGALQWDVQVCPCSIVVALVSWLSHPTSI